MDKEYWKKRYSDKWDDGNRRENLVKEILESWGFEVHEFGFETLSSDYNPDSPDEKGKPDFYIEIDNEKIFFEVTGTDIKSVTQDSGKWIRPDKIEFIKKHKLKAFCIHVLDHLDIVRFIDMNNIEEMRLIHPTIRGTLETYNEIDAKYWGSMEELKVILTI